MKRLKFFLCAAIALGFVACKNESNGDINTSSDKETTYASLRIYSKAPGTRTVIDSETDYKGRDEENKLVKMRLLSSVKPMAWDYAATIGPGVFAPTTPTSSSYFVEAWKTEPGKHFMGIIMNDVDGNLAPGVTIINAKNFKFGSQADPAADLNALSTDNKFIMTSSTVEKEVKDGISKGAVENTGSEEMNTFPFNVERVVAKGLVAKAAGLSGTTLDGRGDIDLNQLNYAGINGAVPTYLFADNAGERTMKDDQLYDNFKSAIHEFVEYQGAKDPATVRDKLIRLSNIKDNMGGYAAVAVAATATDAKATRGIYFFENSVDKSSTWTKENKDFGFYRMAYAKVYAQFTPKTVYYLDTDGTTLRTKNGVAGETFYQGEKDGLFYDSKDAAKKSSIAPDQKAFTYKDGKCAYRALWNRQHTEGNYGAITVNNADTRRNNIYLIEIKGFQTIGMPWDSSDPDDPNLPKPTDPEEPQNPDNPDIEKQDTYMAVTATILPWNLVSRQVILD